jgi:hypothetical protein
MAFLNGLPGQLFDRNELMKRCNLGDTAVTRFVGDVRYSEYHHRVRQLYFGHPEAVKEFKRLLAEREQAEVKL